jgi:tetratricopeptide (TPR) repeat protein
MATRAFTSLLGFGLALASCGDGARVGVESEVRYSAQEPGAAPVPIDAKEAAKTAALRGLSFEGGRVSADGAAARAAVAGWTAADPEARFQLGLRLQEQNLSLEAVRAHADAVLLAPGEARYYLGLGDALLRGKGWNDRAKAAFRSGLELAPDSVSLHGRLADAQWRLGEIDGAETSWQRVLELQPDNLEAASGLARLAFLRGEDEQAWTWTHRVEDGGGAVPAQMRSMLSQRSPEPVK